MYRVTTNMLFSALKQTVRNNKKFIQQDSIARMVISHAGQSCFYYNW